MNLIEIFSIIFIHWLADFVLQTDKQAKGKSKNWRDLIGHTYSYTLLWLLLGGVVCVIDKAATYSVVSVFQFAAVTFVLHTITDYFTSRLNSKLWQRGEVHNFFVSVGFDQVLHYIQLFGTYYILKG